MRQSNPMPFDWFKKKEDKNAVSRPDYSTIDSMDKAIALYNQQQLVKIYLMPLDFGGQDNAMNTLYVSPHVATFKDKFDTMVEQLLIDGKQLSYSVRPEYKGVSFVPSQIVISVTGDVQLTETIEAW